MIRNFYNYNGSDDIFQSLERKKIFGLGGSSGDSLLLQLIKKTLTEIKASDLDGLTKISDRVFSGLTLSSVSLPDSITTIGNRAFEECVINGDIVLPDSITNIGDYALSNSVLTGPITLPRNLTSISTGMFYRSTLINVSLPDNIISIGGSAFYNCKGLENSDITIPDSVTTIGENAFNGTKTNKLTIPGNIASIGNIAFASADSSEVYYNNSWESLFNINFGGSSANPMCRTRNFYFKNASGEYELFNWEVVIPDYITEIPQYVFGGCNQVISLTIHDKVTSIGDGAFISINVKSVTIPDSVISIGKNAFDSTNIKNIVIGRGVTSVGNNGLRCGRSYSKATYTFLGTTPPTIASNTIEKSYVNKIIVPKGCGEAYKTATNWANYADLIEEATE